MHWHTSRAPNLLITAKDFSDVASSESGWWTMSISWQLATHSGHNISRAEKLISEAIFMYAKWKLPKSYLHSLPSCVNIIGDMGLLPLASERNSF